MYYLLSKEMPILATLENMSFFKRSGTYNLDCFGSESASGIFQTWHRRKWPIINQERDCLQNIIFIERVSQRVRLPDSQTILYCIHIRYTFNKSVLDRTFLGKSYGEYCFKIFQIYSFGIQISFKNDSIGHVFLVLNDCL